nr:hypothetical protein [uncultured Rhodopila sp.]
MNDTVLAPAAARPSALRQVCDVIAELASAGDADCVHPFEALPLLRGARFGGLLPAAESGGSLRDVIEEAIDLAEADTNVAHIFRNHFTFVERFMVGSTDERRQGRRRTVPDGGIVSLATTELDRLQNGGTYPLKTTPLPDGDGFRLRGTKHYRFGSLYADLILMRQRKKPDRHRRNVRTLSSLNSAAYKAQPLGAYELHGTRLPGLGFF